MCGRFDVIDNPYVKTLCQQLELLDQQSNLRFSDDVAPASTISIIKQVKNERTIVDASWWLLQQTDESGFKANYKYPSFNTRSDKLNNASAIGYQPFRESRCIIPASSFIEGQDKRYHQLKPLNSAIAFGGIYKTWLNRYTGQMIHSASIITLAGHPKFAHIHKKSLPLMLSLDNKPLTDAWLDPNFTNVNAFTAFMQPVLNQDFIATPIDKPSKRNPIGLMETILADSQ